MSTVPDATPTPTEDFDLSGGALCLDLANTWEDRGNRDTEKLHTYGDLVTFAVEAGVLERAEAARLRRRAAHHIPEARAAWEESRRLRDALYRIFSALAAGREAPKGDLGRLNAALPKALVKLRVAARGEGFAWRWTDPASDLLAPLWPAVRSAAELLVSGELDRLRECASPTCTWLFLDQSRNRSRRWCNMATCGNRAKARRYYRRAKEK